MRARALAPDLAATPIVRSELDDDASLRGAAVLAFEALDNG